MSNIRGEANPTALMDGHTEQKFPWSLGVFDAHCHPTDSMASLDQVARMKASVLTVMATRKEDQHLVAEAADQWPLDTSLPLNGVEGCRIIPSFGWHPWFSHQLYDEDEGEEEPLTGEAKARFFQKVLTPAPDDAFIAALADPSSLSQYLAATKLRLAQYPLALVGEIGIDRSFRIPQSDALAVDEAEPAHTPGARQGRPLSRYRVDMKHQAGLFQAQLRLAGEMRRAVSVHGVAAHGFLLERLRESWKGHEKKGSQRRRKKTSTLQDQAYQDEAKGKPTYPSSFESYPPRVCLHSYSGPVDMVPLYLDPAIPTIIFFSFSEVINFSHAGISKTLEVIDAVPDDRILVESDLHIAGQRMDDLLEAMVRRICDIKRWTIHDGVLQLGRNWQHFALGVESK